QARASATSAKATDHRARRTDAHGRFACRDRCRAEKHTAPAAGERSQTRSRLSEITLDTGALFALERRRQRMREILERALERDQRITVAADVVGEWWRGRSDVRDAILRSVDVEPLTEALAKRAGEALAVVEDATLVDAIVMASAATRG